MKLATYLQRTYSQRSIASYQSRIDLYKKYNQNHTEGNLQEVLNYIKILRHQNKHPKTLRNHLHSIKIYYDYLLNTGQRLDHPCKKLQLKDKIDKQIKVSELYAKEELELYLERTPDHKKLMVSFLVYQGLTASELVGLTAEQIDIDRAELILKNRTLPLKAVQMPLLIKQLQNKNNLLFTTQKGYTYPISELNAYINTGRLKHQKKTPLKIRQSVIKNLLNHNDLRLVQVFAGHKSSSTTQQYRSSGLEELKKTIEELHPIQ